MASNFVRAVLIESNFCEGSQSSQNSCNVSTNSKTLRSSCRPITFANWTSGFAEVMGWMTFAKSRHPPLIYVSIKSLMTQKTLQRGMRHRRNFSNVNGNSLWVNSKETSLASSSRRSILTIYMDRTKWRRMKTPSKKLTCHLFLEGLFASVAKAAKLAKDKCIDKNANSTRHFGSGHVSNFLRRLRAFAKNCSRYERLSSRISIHIYRYTHIRHANYLDTIDCYVIRVLS